MKKTLIRALSFCMILALLTGLMAPFASAIDYEGVEPITLEAAAGLLIDLDTDQVLYEQNADGQRYPASITKIMTALLTLEAVGRGELDLSTVVTVDAAALKDLTSDSSTANLKAGEEITVHDLLYCLMLASANEAANILAMTVCGDIPTFVERMNQRAQELGMTGTHFMNPHGLHNSEHYSTAWDIYRMAKEAMTHAAFREIVSTARYVVPATNMSGERVLLNTNALLTSAKFPGYTFSGTIGIKTGSTGEAGYCLVAAAKKKGHTLVSVVLGADNPTGANGKVQRKQFAESKRLMTWGFESFSPATLLDAESYLKEIPVRFSTESTHVLVQPTQSVTAMVPGEYDASRLELRVKLKEDTATAPIEEGDVLGTITVIYGGEDYGTVDLAAVNSVSFSPFLAFVSSVNTVLKNIYVRLLILIALVMVAIGFVRRYRQRTKEERHQKRKEKQEAKIAFRQREAEARLKDEELAKQERAERERLRKEDLLRRQQEHQERQAKREQELLPRRGAEDPRTGAPGPGGAAPQGAGAAGQGAPPAPAGARRAQPPAGGPAPERSRRAPPAPGAGAPPTGARSPAPPGGPGTPPPAAGGQGGPPARGTPPPGAGRPGAPPLGGMGAPQPAPAALRLVRPALRQRTAETVLL